MDDRPLRLFLAGVASGMALLALTWLTGSALEWGRRRPPGPHRREGRAELGPSHSKLRRCREHALSVAASRCADH